MGKPRRVGPYQRRDLVGLLVAGRVAKRYGLGRALLGAPLLTASAATLIPLAGGSLLLTIPIGSTLPDGARHSDI